MLYNPVLMTHSKPSDHNQSILIVDDDEIILELLAESFNAFGFNVFKSNNGADAWELFKEGSIDNVLTDIQMPYMDGIELARRIRIRSPQTTVAVMTGGDSDVAKELLKDGIIDHFFTKPFAISYICKTLSTEIRIAC